MNVLQPITNDKVDLKDIVRLKDRMTDVEIHVNSPKTMFERVMVRCKVNGEQQQFVNQKHWHVQSAAKNPNSILY